MKTKVISRKLVARIADFVVRLVLPAVTGKPGTTNPRPQVRDGAAIIRRQENVGKETWITKPLVCATQCKAALLCLLSLLPGALTAAEPLHYVLDLRDTGTHTVHVAMRIPEPVAGVEVQIPTWNCLYQIRDFAKDVEDVKGECDGEPIALERRDLNTWRAPDRRCRAFTLRYSVFANEEGPFDSMLNGEHAFLNLAMILFYLPQQRGRPVDVQCRLPENWKLATLLPHSHDEFQAANYDALVDSPVEAGNFEEYAYTQNFAPLGDPTAKKRATIRLVIHADKADYSASRVLDSMHKITTEETRLMQDLPFGEYTFILHFPREGSSTGGMEHANGAVITVGAASIRDNLAYLEDVAAHEFFHSWNVKRIRPQALEPVDYVHGNDTRDLWLCEGVTDAYAELALLRAGLIDRSTFYERVARAVRVLQERDARHFQSAEMSGRAAWLERYSDYARPERSISYYNKGELLGFLLDLGIRHASSNRAGLDDVLRRLNHDFARRHRFYTLSDVAGIIRQLSPGFEIDRFIAEDIKGTAELDYATYFGFAGLKFALQTSELPIIGFSATHNANGLLAVDSVDSDSAAHYAGLQPGDLLVRANGVSLPAGADNSLPAWGPGQQVEIEILREGKSRTVKFRVATIQEVSALLSEDTTASPEQLRVREGWLTGATQAVAGAR